MSRQLFLFAALTLVAVETQAANFIVEARSNNTFSPANLEIQVGDTVTFRNAGGFHNVRAVMGASWRCAVGCDDTGGSGEPSGMAWEFTRSFTVAGSISYQCDVHASFGMMGSITVTGMDAPGQLSFQSANQTLAESAGAFSVTVQRLGGDDGMATVNYSTATGSATAGADFTTTNGQLTWADNDDTPRNIQVPIINDTSDEGNESLFINLSDATGATLGAPASMTLTINDDDESTPNPGVLSFSSNSFRAGEASGNATIQVTRSGGSDGAVAVNYSTSNGSALAGSDYGSANGTLNWGSGDMSVKSFLVPLLDDALAEAGETVNLTLQNPSGGATLGTSNAVLTIDDDEFAPCVADADTLCLGANGRFEVKANFTDFMAMSGNAKKVDIGKRDSGLFFFFDSNNIEMLIKVLDGCAINNRYWVFYAATTNVKFDVTVRDSTTNISQPYANALGNPAAPVLDVNAFVCP